MLLCIGAFLLVRAFLVQSRSFVVYNNCPFTVWPALYTDLNVEGNVAPSHPTGWVADAYTSVTIDIPNNWKAGRIWARRNCDFSVRNDVLSCVSGGCNGGFLCDARTGTGVPPATLAEWTLSGDGNRDFYDVSLVDGYNIPMRIDNNVGCPIADCLVDLGPACPEPLRGPFDANGFSVGCKSACEVDPNKENSPNCCSGSFNTAATCPPAGVQFYDYFKSSCPNAYAYAYDESSNSALFTCDSGLNADYTLTFCPGTNSIPTGGSLSASPAAASTPVSVVNLSTTFTEVPISTINTSALYTTSSSFTSLVALTTSLRTTSSSTIPITNLPSGSTTHPRQIPVSFTSIILITWTIVQFI